MNCQISLDNGLTYQTAAEAMPEILRQDLWESIINMMDNDTREQVHQEIAPCSELEFLRRYLELSSQDLILG